MKTFLKLILFVLIVVFFGWLYIMYLYLHEENQSSLKHIKNDFEDEVRSVVKKVSKEKKAFSSSVKESFSERQKDIGVFIQSMSKDVFEIKEIAQRFANVSDRTLRRDMQKLEDLGLVKKIGSTKNSKYKIVAK